jgi:tRNA(fMet)-specific endonuclease VapC
MLDTDTCIYIINRRPESVFDRLRAHRVGDIAISTITVSELRYGAEKNSRPEENHQALDSFLTPLEILEYGEAESRTYGMIRSHLERSGKPIGSMDLLIAAHAVNLGAILVTQNAREFERVPDLRIESWA